MRLLCLQNMCWMDQTWEWNICQEPSALFDDEQNSEFTRQWVDKHVLGQKELLIVLSRHGGIPNILYTLWLNSTHIYRMCVSHQRLFCPQKSTSTFYSFFQLLFDYGTKKYLRRSYVLFIIWEKNSRQEHSNKTRWQRKGRPDIWKPFLNKRFIGICIDDGYYKL